MLDTYRLVPRGLIHSNFALIGIWMGSVLPDFSNLKEVKQIDDFTEATLEQPTEM